MVTEFDTYSARSRVRNSSIVLHPTVVCTFLMSIGTIKHSSDVSHAIYTDSRTFEDRAERQQHESLTGSKDIY